jgi:cyclopropane fatty-acyl-phospholipid synthase-like methyltransferase
MPSEPLELPSCDDRRLWDVWMSWYQFPALAAADDLGLFALLERGPLTRDEAAKALGLSPRSAEALLGVMTALGLLEQRDGRFLNAEVARNFLVPSSPYYWGGMIHFVRDLVLNRTTVKDVLVKDRPKDGSMDAFWETHELKEEEARAFTAAMHTRSLHLGVAVARRLDFRGVRRFLDVAGGSGCFSIALARQHPHVRCTVLELPTVCTIAREYIDRFGVRDRVDALEADMFRDAWPRGYDAVFFSNIYHDWDRTKCERLTRRSFEALPSGGRILIHEVLLDDTKDGPLVGVTDSLHMVFFTEGKQRTLGEFRELLEGAGFRDVAATPTYGYYSVVSAVKP